MSGKAFLDTNLFVYMQSGSDIEKKEISYMALESFDCIVSTQVLSEFCNVALKKLMMNSGQIQQVLHAINSTCDVSVITLTTIKMALQLKKRHGFSYYDSLIVASALENDCVYLFSEDMSDGDIIENKLEIVNIFARPSYVSKDVK